MKGWSLSLNAKQTMIVDLKKNATKELAYWHVNWFHVERMPNVSQNFTLPNANVLEGIKAIPIVHAVKVLSKNISEGVFHCLKLTFVDFPRPPDITVGCRTDRDCPDYTACENTKCINPCAVRDPCARNAYCKVINHQPVCTCPDGYIGDPTTSCELRKYKRHLPSEKKIFTNKPNSI